MVKNARVKNLMASEMQHLPYRRPDYSVLLKTEKINIIKKLLKSKNAVLIAHYYTDSILQNLAEETGGCVADSLEMARFGMQHQASTLIIAGVRFMGETAKILNPEKKVLMINMKATCSLDLGCPADKFINFCDNYPDRTVVVYANTSVAVKARADWVVTSGCAINIVEYLHSLDKPIIWAPDKYLGDYIHKNTGADMLIWQSACIVHEEFKAQGIKDLKHLYPQAAILVHPESPSQVIELADVVGSTSQLISAAMNLPNQVFIVATDRGIFYKMQQAIGYKKLLIEAPTAGNGATCRSCARCPWMAMNSLDDLKNVFKNPYNEIIISEYLQKKAKKSLDKMLNFTNKVEKIKRFSNC